MANNPRVYMDIAIDGKATGRIEFELFADVAPMTAENFRVLCTGEKGVPLHYKGTSFTSVIPGAYSVGGKIVGAEESIHGPHFPTENFIKKHTGMGTLSMCNYTNLMGEKASTTQFFICNGKTQWLDGNNVVFGEVVKGLDVVREIENVGSITGKTSAYIVVADCGQLPLQGSKSSKELLEKMSSDFQNQLAGILNKSSNEYAELIANIDGVDLKKAKDVADVKKELDCLLEMNKTFNQLAEYMPTIQTDIQRRVEDAFKKHVDSISNVRAELQKKISNRKKNVLVLETIESMPDEDLLSIQNAIEKRMNVRSSENTMKRKEEVFQEKRTGDGNKIQEVKLDRSGMHTILSIEEVNIFKGDEIISFTNPKIEADVSANAWVVSGTPQAKKLRDYIPCATGQLNPKTLEILKELAEGFHKDAPASGRSVTPIESDDDETTDGSYDSNEDDEDNEDESTDGSDEDDKDEEDDDIVIVNA